VKHKIPIPTIKRFPSYLRLMKQYNEEGRETISATILAKDLGLNPIQVRKDLSFSGIEGKPKVGFKVTELIESLTNSLGWDNVSDAIIIGAGNLGKALISYEGFENYGFQIVAAFDKDPAKDGLKVGKVEVRPLVKMEEYIIENRINIAILAVPVPQAQVSAELLVKCGIKAIWSFVPTDLRLPSRIALQRTDLATHFAVLAQKLQTKIDNKENLPESEDW
jgi:redox-sensing transcriptional repressor